MIPVGFGRDALVEGHAPSKLKGAPRIERHGSDAMEVVISFGFGRDALDYSDALSKLKRARVSNEGGARA